MSSSHVLFGVFSHGDERVLDEPVIPAGDSFFPFGFILIKIKEYDQRR